MLFALRPCSSTALAEAQEALAANSKALHQVRQQLATQNKASEELSALRDEIEVLRPKATALEKAEVRWRIHSGVARAKLR